MQENKHPAEGRERDGGTTILCKIPWDTLRLD